MRLDQDNIPDRVYKPRPPKPPKAASSASEHEHAEQSKRKSGAPKPKQTSLSFGGATYTVGDTCYGEDQSGQWCEARIIQMNGCKVKLHYVNAGSRDEWKSLSSSTIRLTPPEDEYYSADARRSSSGAFGVRPHGYDKGSLDEAYSFLGEGSPSFGSMPSGFDKNSPSRFQLPETLSLGPHNDDDAFIEESSAPIASKTGNSFMSVTQHTTMLTDEVDSELREHIKGLQLTRDFVRTIQRHKEFQIDLRDYYVRLNMGSRFFMYVAAQVVSIDGDEVQVRGVDSNQPNKVQHTKLAYVSNATFKEEEINNLLSGLRVNDVLDLQVSKVVKMIEEKNYIMQDTSYKALRHMMQQNAAAEQAAAAPSAGRPPPMACAPSTTFQAAMPRPMSMGFANLPGTQVLPSAQELGGIPTPMSYSCAAGSSSTVEQQQARLRQGWKPPETRLPHAAQLGMTHSWGA